MSITTTLIKGVKMSRSSSAKGMGGQQQTVTLGAKLVMDQYGINGHWQMPAPIRHDRFWKSEGMRRAAEKLGLNVLTAGTPYTVAVPVYRGVANPVYRSMRSRAHRISKGRWAN